MIVLLERVRRFQMTMRENERRTEGERERAWASDSNARVGTDRICNRREK